MNNNDKKVKNINPIFVYIFLLIHSGVFSISGFFIFYSAQIPAFGFVHGGMAILVYTALYSAIFGKEEIKNLFIGAAIGILQVYSWLELIGSVFVDSKKGIYKTFESFPLYYHIIPGVYFILYIFLLKNAIIDLLGARKDPSKANVANWVFYVLSGVIFILPIALI